MENENPNKEYTNKSIGNIMYWQGSIKKQLKNKIDSIWENNKSIFWNNYLYLLSCGSGFGKKIYSMESVGIHVFDTMDNLDIELEGNIQKDRNNKIENIIYLVCLISSLNELVI